MFLMTIHTSKICVRIGINLAHIALGVHDHSSIRSLLQNVLFVSELTHVNV
jgi:hypothetical protein